MICSSPIHSVPQVAVEGCCHGELDKIYDTMKHLERQSGKTIDLLICCGDFQVLPCLLLLASSSSCSSFQGIRVKLPHPSQAVRNMDDLECLACPPKYRALNTFWKYYTGQATAPYPTLFSRSQSHVPPSAAHHTCTAELFS